MADLGNNSVLPPDEAVFIPGEEERPDSMGYARNLLIFGVLLLVFGLTMLYSASYGTVGLKYFRSQLVWCGIGVAAAAAVYALGYRTLARWSPFFVLVSAMLLASTVLFFPAINGAHRWMRLRLPGMGLFSFQPSELAKIALALFVARYCSENLRTFNNLRGKNSFWPLCGGCVLVVGGILAGRDFGTTILTLLMAGAVMFAAGMYLRYILLPVGLVGLMGLYIFFFDPVRLGRVTSFLRPEAFARTGGYQLFNSQLALGSGGWFGQGFMESRLKAKYLPEAHTDFILAIVGEELGFAAMIMLIIVYAVFTYYALRISLNAGTRLGMLLGFGLTVAIAAQAAINIAVISGAAPTKGMPAPFISYGGSNMLMCFIAMGLLVSIAVDTSNPDYNAGFLKRLRLSR